MIVYVESNFVVELALQQEQVQDAEVILRLAETNAVRLIIPSFALSEPFTNIWYRGTERQRMLPTLRQQARELRRSALHQEPATQLLLLLDTLTALRKTEMDQLEQVLDRILKAGQTIELNYPIFLQARQYKVDFSLKSQDAVIFALILAHLQQQDPQESKCFISRDVEAFFGASTKADLQRFNCRYISSFQGGLSYIQNELSKSP